MAIEALDGSNWRFLVITHHSTPAHEWTEKKHITDTKDSNDTEWDSKEEIILGVLEMYCQKDIWTTVADNSVNSKVKTCKEKWEKLMTVYGGIGSMSSFNTWVALTSTALEPTQPRCSPSTTETKRRLPHPGE